MSQGTVRIAAAQTPEFREDPGAALGHAAEVARVARDAGARLLCFPEGYLQGYLTEAEAARRHALDLESAAFRALVSRLPQDAPAIIMGLIEAADGALFNTAVVLRGGRLVGRYRKRRLLRREGCFQPGDRTPVFEVEGLRFGINICFDTNFAEEARAVADQGATLLVCPANNLLPAEAAGRWKDEHNRVRGERCRETGLWLVSADVTGRRGDSVAWGPTAVLDPTGAVAAELPLDAPGLLLFDLPLAAGPRGLGAARPG